MCTRVHRCPASRSERCDPRSQQQAADHERAQGQRNTRNTQHDHHREQPLCTLRPRRFPRMARGPRSSAPAGRNVRNHAHEQQRAGNLVHNLPRNRAQHREDEQRAQRGIEHETPLHLCCQRNLPSSCDPVFTRPFVHHAAHCSITFTVSAASLL